MNIRSPVEVEAIRQHIASLKQQDWLGQARQWWPDYLFHCTDVRNVANILRSGEMLSRKQILESRQLHVDIASPEIIGQTATAGRTTCACISDQKLPPNFKLRGFDPEITSPTEFNVLLQYTC